MSAHRTLVVLGLLGLAAGGCGDDDGDTGSIGSVAEWCAVVGDVDERFTAVDTSDDPFDVKQDHYREINALLQDLTRSVALVDADARSAVEEAITWGVTLTDVLIDADSEEQAADELFGDDGLFAEQEQLDEAGAVWIQERCGVDIDGEG